MIIALNANIYGMYGKKRKLKRGYVKYFVICIVAQDSGVNFSNTWKYHRLVYVENDSVCVCVYFLRIYVWVACICAYACMYLYVLHACVCVCLCVRVGE